MELIGKLNLTLGSYMYLEEILHLKYFRCIQYVFKNFHILSKTSYINMKPKTIFLWTLQVSEHTVKCSIGSTIN